MKKGKIIFFFVKTEIIIHGMSSHPWYVNLKGTASTLKYEKRCNFGEVALIIINANFFVENENFFLELISINTGE